MIFGTIKMYSLVNFSLLLLIFHLRYVFPSSNLFDGMKSYGGSRNEKTKTNILQSKVEYLREQGSNCISNKNFKEATKYYSAILQLLAGQSGEESGNLRRRCGLTLAECELKSGNFYNAIMTCSEIIDESPNLDSTLTSDNNDPLFVNKAVSKAYYKRGIALEKANETALALSDYELALSLQPKNKKIQEKVKQYKLHIKLINETTGDIDNIGDYVEYISQQFPKRQLSQTEIKELTFKKSQKPIKTDHKLTISEPNTKFPGMFGGGNPLSGLLGAGGGGLADMAPLISSLTGIDSKIIMTLINIFQTFSNIISKINKFVKMIYSNIQLLLLSFTIVWFSFTLFKNFYQK